MHEFALEAGGWIEADNVPGAGAAFTLRLPVAAAVPAVSVPAAPTVVPAGTETILLAEDDDVVRDVAGRMLSGAGYTVIGARYGSEALELAERHDIDLLLTDVVMPGLSGPETARMLRERSPELPVLFMSGYAPETEGSLAGAELVRRPSAAGAARHRPPRTHDLRARAWRGRGPLTQLNRRGRTEHSRCARRAPSRSRARRRRATWPRLVRHVVEVAIGVGVPVVDRRRQHAVVQREHAHHRLDRAGRAEAVAR